MKKTLAIAGAVAAIGTAGIATTAYATTNSGSSEQRTSLAETLASRFNLNKDEVQKVIDEEKTARQAEREQKIKDEISSLVSSGKLTQDQADKINQKRSELQKEREQAKANRESGSTTESDKSTKSANREAKKQELTNWLKEQGISEEYAYLLGGRGMKNNK